MPFSDRNPLKNLRTGRPRDRPLIERGSHPTIRLCGGLCYEDTPYSCMFSFSAARWPQPLDGRQSELQVSSELTPGPRWRTPEDSFQEVWEEVQSLLEVNPGLEAKTIFEYLQRRVFRRASKVSVRDFRTQCVLAQNAGQHRPVWWVLCYPLQGATPKI